MQCDNRLRILPLNFSHVLADGSHIKCWLLRCSPDLALRSQHAVKPSRIRSARSTSSYPGHNITTTTATDILCPVLSFGLAVAAPTCGEPPLPPQCGESELPCWNGMDAMGCDMGMHCFAGTECPVVCPTMPVPACPEGELTCPNGMDDQGCDMGSYCLADAACPVVCPASPPIPACNEGELPCWNGLDANFCDLGMNCVAGEECPEPPMPVPTFRQSLP